MGLIIIETSEDFMAEDKTKTEAQGKAEYKGDKPGWAAVKGYFTGLAISGFVSTAIGGIIDVVRSRASLASGDAPAAFKNAQNIVAIAGTISIIGGIIGAVKGHKKAKEAAAQFEENQITIAGLKEQNHALGAEVIRYRTDHAAREEARRNAPVQQSEMGRA